MPKENNPKKIKILSGPMGTELQRRGYETKLPLWSGTANLDVPEMVKQIHIDYLKAGADYLITNTFRTNIRPWKRVRSEAEAKETNKVALEIVGEVKSENPGVEVGISISTIEDCYEPEKTPPQAELESEHAWSMEQFEPFVKNGVADFFLIETINTIREAKVLAGLASKFDVPIWVSVVVKEDGTLISGEPIADFVKEISQYNPQVLGINCRPIEVLSKAAPKLAESWEGEKVIYGNGHGEPANDLGWKFYDRCSPQDYVDHAREWVEQGFNILGSCCGSSPEFIRLLAQTFKK